MAKNVNNEDKEVLDEEEDDECFDYDYYNNDADNDLIDCDSKIKDSEYFEYECLLVEQVERLLNESVESVCSLLNIKPSQAKVLLFTHKWSIDKVKEKYQQQQPQSSRFVQNYNRVNTDNNTQERVYYSQKESDEMKHSRKFKCNICLQVYQYDKCSSLSCEHYFCNDCWLAHIEYQVSQGNTISIECMAQCCHLLVPEDFALELLTRTSLREKYQQFAFSAYVYSHPELRFCPGNNCNAIIKAKERKAKRVQCKYCLKNFCFKCGCEYHAPTDCDTIKKWLTKCADDSETANYISANTKDCPKCHICIEKNGGCNHMQCFSCKNEFCWMCLGDWKTHGSEYYECSRYKENSSVVNSIDNYHAKAREALKKYLFYYERWENHARSLRLEEQTLARIKERIQEKVMSNKGTWIDWQYLIEAASLLAKCRYTLQYTYPYAYFMDAGARKQLFEYQQAQLEAEIENLSWKIERAETTDRGELENQMDIAEKRRATLLKDFLTVS